MAASAKKLDREIDAVLGAKRVSLDKLYTSRDKLDETLTDIREGRPSRSTGQPLEVSHLDTPKGCYFVMDGNHRAVEAIHAGEKTIAIKIATHLPRIERTGGAFSSFVNNKVRIRDLVKRR